MNDGSSQRLTLPSGDLSDIFLQRPAAEWENIELKQFLAWLKEACSDQPVVGATIYEHGACDGNIDPRFLQRISYTTSLINDKLHIDNAMIAKPQPRTHVTRLNQPPHSLLVHGLHVEDADTLICDKAIGSPHAAVFFHRVELSFPSFIGAVHNLDTCLVLPVYEIALSHILTLAAETIFLQLLAQQPVPISTPQDVQAHIANKMFVKRLDCKARNNVPAPVFLIYTLSLASDFHTHSIWTAY